MGILHGLINWGIDVMDNTEKDLHRLGQRLGYMPLSWRRAIMDIDQLRSRGAHLNDLRSRDGLLWRVPDPDVAMASSMSRIQSILVSEYEQAMVLKDGMLTEQITLPPGLYDISRTVQVRGQIEIIWTSTREFEMRWGVPDVITVDRVTVGASGYFSTAMVDPEAFLRNVAGNNQVYTPDDMSKFAKPEVGSVLRDLMARKTVLEFQSARQEFIASAKEMLQPTFSRWGLEFRGLTIENQNIPEEFRQAAQARTIVTMSKEAEIEGATADVSLAQLEAQKRYFLAQADATKFYVIKDAEVENMRRQMGIGMDPLKLKMAEAMEELARTPSQGGLVDGRVQIMNYLSGSLNSIPGMSPVQQDHTPPAGQPGFTPPGIAAPLNSGIPADAASPSVPVDQTTARPPNQAAPGGFAPFSPYGGMNNLGGTPVVNSISSQQQPPAHDSVQSQSVPTSGQMTREKIMEMLEKLDERLITGEITEQKHSELYARLQKKLSEML